VARVPQGERAKPCQGHLDEALHIEGPSAKVPQSSEHQTAHLDSAVPHKMLEFSCRLLPSSKGSALYFFAQFTA